MTNTVALVIGQLTHGGAERQLVDLASGLVGSRYLPLVICLSDEDEPHSDELRKNGVKVITISRRGSWEFGRARQLASILREHKVDIAHAFLEVANDYTYLATQFMRVLPWIASMRNCKWADSRVRRFIDVRALKSASVILVNSKEGRSFLERGGVYHSNIVVVPNGVRCERFNCAEGAGRMAELKSSLGIPQSALVIGTVGLMKKQKNPGMFLDVARQLMLAHPSVHFVWVGGGEELGRYKSISESDPCLRERIHWLGFRDDIPAMMQIYDVFVLTSTAEGMPNAIMEAMASSLPVIATRVGGTPELIVEGVTGSLVKQADSAAMVEILNTFLGDESKRKKWGEAGKNRITKAFSSDTMVSTTMDIYDSILSKN